MDTKKEPLIIHNPLLKKFLDTLRKDEIYRKTLDSYTEKKFKASDTKQSYRTLNSWDSAGLLLTLPNINSKWRRFSVVEILWIYIIKELRRTGFSKKEILELKNSLFPCKPNSTISDTETFAKYIISVVAKRDVMLVVTPEGRGDFAFDAEFLESELKNEHFPKTYTVININKLCAIFTNNPEYNKKNQFAYIPLMKELELLNEIKNNESLKEVTLTVKDKKLTRADYKTPRNPKQVTSVLNEALAKGGDGELHIKWQNGNIVYTEEIEKN